MLYWIPDDLQTVWIHRTTPLDHPAQAVFHLNDGTFHLTVWNWEKTQSVNLVIPMEHIQSWRPLT